MFPLCANIIDILIFFIMLVRNKCVNILMLQIDRIYEIFSRLVYRDFLVISLPNGVPNERKYPVTWQDVLVFGDDRPKQGGLFFYDQEPLVDGMFDKYANVVTSSQHTECATNDQWVKDIILVTSEKSNKVDAFVDQAPKRFIRNLNHSVLYYFFMGLRHWIGSGHTTH